MSTTDGTVRSFSTLVAGIDDGALHHELTREVDRIVLALVEAGIEGGGSTASLSLKLSFKRDGRQIDVSGTVGAAMPTKPRGKSTFWVTADNQLTRRNPRQQDLPFAEMTPAERRTTPID